MEVMAAAGNRSPVEELLRQSNDLACEEQLDEHQEEVVEIESNVIPESDTAEEVVSDVIFEADTAEVVVSNVISEPDAAEVVVANLIPEPVLAEQVEETQTMFTEQASSLDSPDLTDMAKQSPNIFLNQLTEESTVTVSEIENNLEEQAMISIEVSQANVLESHQSSLESEASVEQQFILDANTGELTTANEDAELLDSQTDPMQFINKHV